MALENLQLFRDIAHARSVSKGARLNGISQSAASQQILELERQLGVTLLDTGTRPLAVTAAGKLYLDYCRDALRRRQEFEAELHRLKHDTAGKVRIAAIYSVGLSEMSEIESRFSQRFPNAELVVSYLRPEKVFEAVEEDQADLGLMSYAESTRDVVALPWREEEMVVAASPQHPLAGRRTIEAEDLAGLDFVGFDEDLPIQQDIDRYLRDRDVSVVMVFRFDNLQMIKEAVAHGVGISIMPERVMREDLAQGRLVSLKLNPSDLFRPVRIVHRRRKVFSDVAQGLLEMLRENQAAEVLAAV
ncbi:MAG TPA: LysR family transcriptional regulator [Bryobacteraceae bacterium]|nr:LysR family transcriptional regulator [Bryobacteraceae bacterium]